MMAMSEFSLEYNFILLLSCWHRTGTLGVRTKIHSADGDTELCLENNQSVDGDRETVWKMMMDVA